MSFGNCKACLYSVKQSQGSDFECRFNPPQSTLALGPGRMQGSIVVIANVTHWPTVQPMAGCHKFEIDRRKADLPSDVGAVLDGLPMLGRAKGN